MRWIIGPNRVHYWWIPDWHAAYPGADVWLAPLIRKQAGQRIAFPARDLAAVTPRDIRLFYSRTATRRAVETMIGWQPERITLSHGHWYQSDAVAELRRAFRWLL